MQDRTTQWILVKRLGIKRNWHGRLQCPRSLWAYRVGQDPSDSKFNWLHVRHLPILLCSFEVCSIDSSKMKGKFPEVSMSTGYFSNSTGSSATIRQFFPDIAPDTISKWRSILSSLSGNMGHPPPTMLTIEFREFNRVLIILFWKPCFLGVSFEI